MYLIMTGTMLQVVEGQKLSGFRDLDEVLGRSASTEELDGLHAFRDKAKPGDIFRCPGLSVIRLGQEFGPIDGAD